ncbi:HprK-related kinase A [Chitinimonas naiadis]
MRLRQGALRLQLTPFVVRIGSPFPWVATELSRMYAEFPILEQDGFADFHIDVQPGVGLHRWIRPQVIFHFDGKPAFKPLPQNQAYPMLEWGLNWCIASHAHQFLIIHAAVIERQGQAIIMPAPPGSGKSTLCAALVSRGWRLLSDELTLLNMETGLVQGMARPINLKNQSIDVMNAFQPDATMTTPVKDTLKGTVALLRPPAESVRRVHEPAIPARIVFPRYKAGEPAAFTPVAKAHAALRVADEAFNYGIHGSRGFIALTGLVDRCDCSEFAYGNLEEAMAAFDTLIPTHHADPV